MATQLVKALRSLGTAGSVEAFAKHEEHIDWLHVHFTQEGCAPNNHIPPSLAQLFEQGLISWLSAAVCRALFLMQLSPTIMATAICSIANLCSVTGLCAEAWTSRDVHAGQLQTDKLKIAQQVAKTDLLTYLAQMCTSTADQLQLPAVTQLSPAQLQCSLGVGHGLLQLFVSLARSWPGKVLTGKTIAQTVQPAVKLAAAVLDCSQVAVPVSSSSSSSSSASSSNLEQLWRNASRPAARVGDVLAVAINNEVVGEEVVVNTAQPCLRPTAQLLATADVRKLLKVNVAMYAMLLHHQQQQQQRVTADQHEVPPYHLKLFSALGLARYGTDQSRNPIPADAPTVAVNAVLISTVSWQQQSASTTSSSSIASSASSSTNPVAGETQLSPELLPLLLTVLELQLLALDAGVMNASLQLMHMLIEEIYKTKGDISLVAPPGQVQNLGIRQVLAAKAALRNVSAAIAGPVLLSLAPAVTQLLRSSSSSSGRNQQQQQHFELDLVGGHFVALMVCMAVTGDTSSTALLLQQQPAACSSAFEAALRLAAAKEQLPDLYEMQVWQLYNMTPAAVRAQFTLTVISLVTAAAAAAQPPSTPAAGATPQQQQQQPLLQLQVCSLLTSYVKYVTLLAAKPPHSTWGPLQLINPMLLLPKGLGSSSSSSGSSGSSEGSISSSIDDKDAVSVTTLLEVLVARCLIAAGCFLDTWCSAVCSDAAAAATAEAAEAAAEALQPQGIKHMDNTLDAAAAAVSWLCDELQRQCTAVAAPGARSTSVLQDLVTQGRQLADALLRAKQQLASSSSSSSSDSVAAAAQLLRAEVVQQLQQFGAGVCAQLPCRHCCNHPACVNMAKTSELELVGGKSCICAGCRVARYCGKDCQVAHWKAHKRVCKQLQAAAAAPQ